MKYLLAFLISLNLYAGGWIPAENYLELQEGQYSTSPSKEKCESINKRGCLEVFKGFNPKYSKIENGKIVEDSNLKSIYESELTKKINRKARIKRGKKKRVQCDEALSYITDTNSENGLTEDTQEIIDTFEQSPSHAW